MDYRIVLDILAITIPLTIALGAFVWRWQEKQDCRIAECEARETKLETEVEHHSQEFERGSGKFDGIAAHIGSLETDMAATKNEVANLAETQRDMNGKLDTLLSRPSSGG